MPRGRPRADEFSELDQDFKSALEAMSESEINVKIAEIAKNQEDLDTAKKDDVDLQNLKEQVKVALEPYSQATKANKQSIKYAYQILKSRGIA